MSAHSLACCQESYSTHFQHLVHSTSFFTHTHARTHARTHTHTHTNSDCFAVSMHTDTPSCSTPYVYSRYSLSLSSPPPLHPPSLSLNLSSSPQPFHTISLMCTHLHFCLHFLPAANAESPLDLRNKSVTPHAH